MDSNLPHRVLCDSDKCHTLFVIYLSHLQKRHSNYSCLLSVLTYQKYSFAKIEDISSDFNVLVIDMYTMCSLVASGRKTVGYGGKSRCVAYSFFSH